MIDSSGWRKRQIALDKKAENAREMGLDYEVHSCSPFCTQPMCVAEAVQAEREVCIADIMWHVPRSGHDTPEYQRAMKMIERIQTRNQTTCNHEWVDDTKLKPQWRCIKCGAEYKKEQA